MERLRIGIDVMALRHPDTGIGNCTYNLLKRLFEIDKINAYVLFFFAFRDPSDAVIKEFLSNENVAVKRLKLSDRILKFAWHRLNLLNIEDLIGDVDVYHSCDWLFPARRKAKVVITIHDLAHEVLPQLYPPQHLKAKFFVNRLIAKKSDAIITVSNSTKKDVVKYLNVPEKKIKVIHHGSPKEDPDYSEPWDENLFRTLSSRYRIKRPYVLFLGSQEPRKNLPRLIEAYKACNDKLAQRYELLIVGNPSWAAGAPWKKVEELKLQDSVVLIENIGKKEIITLLKGADLFAYVSLYEGFGLPLLEAMACGVPVLTSNVSSIPEVVEDAAIMVRPDNIDEISSAMFQLLTDKRLRGDLIDRGRQRIEQFSWRRGAEETLKLYKELGE